MSKSTVDAKIILSMLLESCSAQLFRGDNGEPCISVVVRNQQRTMILTSQRFTDWFISEVRKRSWQVSDVLRDEIINELVGLASDNLKPISVRVARTPNTLQIDLNDETYDVVHIDEGKKGFQIKQPSEAFFLRPQKQRPLPAPVSVKIEDFISSFKNFIRVDGFDWLLILAFILKALDRNRGSYVTLVIEGPQGSGKTKLSQWLKMLIDPADPLFFSPPANRDGIVVASVHSYLLAFDNISGLDHKMADVFCRLATGGGISKRKHYENHEEAVYKIHRPCIINGIDEPSARPDFVDRCVTIELKPIVDEDRIAETELDKAFESKLPILLGGTYELLSECLCILPTIPTDNLPRMTDYARMGIAIEKVLGLKPNTFLSAYKNNRSEQSESAFWGDDLCCAIYDKLSAHRSNGRLEGAAHELMTKLFQKHFGSIRPNAPRTAKGFAGWLKRIEPLLALKGIVIERPPRTAKARTIVIRWVSAPDEPEGVESEGASDVL